MRTHHDVIAYIATVAIQLPTLIGFAVEPIGTMADPNNEIDGDTYIRFTFQIESVNPDEEVSKFRYCAVFEAIIAIELYLTMSDERIARNMIALHKRAEEFIEARADKKPTHVVSANGIESMSDLVRRANDTGNKKPH